MTIKMTIKESILSIDDSKIKDEIVILKSIGKTEDIRETIEAYKKTDLHKLLAFLCIGRKSYDSKQVVTEKLFNYFKK